MPESQLDLSRLALDRSSNVKPPRRKPWLLRYVLPFSIVSGFLVLLGSSAGRQLLPAQKVTVIPVIVKRGEVQRQGTALFQAAGWIEPCPTSVSVAALAPGVIEKLLVVEGQQVARGESVARLLAIDSELAVEQAEVKLAIREAELHGAQAESDAAVIRLQKPVHLQVQFADAKSMLARANTEMEKLPFRIEAAEANLEFTLRSLEGKQSAESAIAGVIVQRAIRDHATAHAVLKELTRRVPNLKREVEALQGKVDALRQQLDLLVEENEQLQQATARFASSTAHRDEARLVLRRAKLNLERTVIRAPIAGRILRLVALPGARVMGLDQNAGHSSSTVVEMYDPTKLQVRADVRLEHVTMVLPGAPVAIETASSGHELRGRVLQTTSSANIQKNTLEVKVELIEPPPTVSPEMLVTATFQAPKTVSTSVKPTETARILMPEQLIRTEDDGSFVWVVDSGNRVARKVLTVGETDQDGLTEIIEGLNVTDKLISSDVNGIQPGDVVVVGGEDQAIGMGR